MKHKMNYISLHEHNLTLYGKCECGNVNNLKKEEPGFHMGTNMMNNNFKCKEDK